MRQVWVEAPASSANVGPGFDVFAIALDKPRDRIHLSRKGSTGLSVKMGQVSGGLVPTSATKNGAGVVCLEIAKDYSIRESIEVRLKKGVPIGQGMGSSGASAAAAAVAMNELFGLGLSHNELIFYAGKGERVTSGAPHYDNVAASIAGGFVVVSGAERPFVIRFDPPRGMALCLATPVVKLPGRKTAYARSLVPKTVQLRMMVSNIASASLVVSGFAKGDLALIGRGLDDKVVEQARKSMIPGYGRVKKGAIQAGAEGVCISGAGPSMLAVVDRKKSDPRRVLEAMLAAFRRERVESSGYVTKVGEGARVVKSS